MSKAPESQDEGTEAEELVNRMNRVRQAVVAEVTHNSKVAKDTQNYDLRHSRGLVSNLPIKLNNA